MVAGQGGDGALSRCDEVSTKVPMTKLVERLPRRNTQAVTIGDVARRAGVSTMSVSRVINGKGGVGEETRGRIQAVIREMNYSPSPAAQGLASAVAARIGLLYTAPSGAYLSAFLLGTLDEISRTGDSLVLQRCDTPGELKQAIDKLLTEAVDGVVLPPPLCDSAEALSLLAKAGKPVVAVATGRDDDRSLTVRVDDYAGACAMTEHLIALGHRRLGFIGGDEQQAAAGLRLQGFKDVMAKAGHKPVVIERGDYSYRSGIEAATRIFDAAAPPSAIFASNDDMASAAVSVAHRRGLDVPGDVTIVGFDDSLLAATTWPELTTVHQPIGEMARTAMELLLRHIRNERSGVSSPDRHTRLDYSLVIRDSDGPPKSSKV